MHYFFYSYKDCSFCKLLSNQKVPKGTKEAMPAIRARLKGHLQSTQVFKIANASNTNKKPCTQPLMMTACGNLKMYFNGMETNNKTR